MRMHIMKQVQPRVISLLTTSLLVDVHYTPAPNILPGVFIVASMKAEEMELAASASEEGPGLIPIGCIPLKRMCSNRMSPKLMLFQSGVVQSYDNPKMLMSNLFSCQSALLAIPYPLRNPNLMLDT